MTVGYSSRRSRHVEGDADRRARAERSSAQIIKELQRHRCGRRAETLPEDQPLLGLEDVEQVAASRECEVEAANPPSGPVVPPTAA